MTIEFAWIAPQPVPPLPTGRTPVISDARLIAAVDTAPAVAFKKPESEPIESEPKKALVEDAYEALIPVEEAYGKVEAVVVVAVKYAATAWPTTESLAYGEVVPTPKLPVVSTRAFSTLSMPNATA